MNLNLRRCPRPARNFSNTVGREAETRTKLPPAARPSPGLQPRPTVPLSNNNGGAKGGRYEEGEERGQWGEGGGQQEGEAPRGGSHPRRASAIQSSLPTSRQYPIRSKSSPSIPSSPSLSISRTLPHHHRAQVRRQITSSFTASASGGTASFFEYSRHASSAASVPGPVSTARISAVVRCSGTRCSRASSLSKNGIQSPKVCIRQV